jgi:hypothetical protein
MDHAPETPTARTAKKPSYPIGEELRGYLKKYRRERELSVTYERLRFFHAAVPLMDHEGRNTLWESVVYRSEEMGPLNEDLKRIYALLRVDGDFSVMEHLYIDRIDFCGFGNSMPFRIRIVNAFNDNADYFYIKQADASRVYGLELEHLLSPPTVAPWWRSTSPASPAIFSSAAGSTGRRSRRSASPRSW